MYKDKGKIHQYQTTMTQQSMNHVHNSRDVLQEYRGEIKLCITLTPFEW